MNDRKTSLFTLFALVVVRVLAIPRQEGEAIVEDIVSNDEFYANDDWGTMDVVGASISSLFEDDENQLEYGPPEDFDVHGFSTETEPADKYLPNSDRPPLQATPPSKEEPIDPKDWDMTVDRNVDEVGVSGQAFVGTEQQPEHLDSSKSAKEEQPQSLEAPTTAKEDVWSTEADNGFGYNDEVVRDEIEHKDVDDDFFDDDDLLEYDQAGDVDDNLDYAAVDKLHGIKEIYSDSDTESVLNDADPLAGIEVKGQAILTNEDEMHDNFLLEVENFENTGPQLSGSGMADEFMVTGQSVKVPDDEYETELDEDDEDSDNTDELFVDATERREQATIAKLFEDSAASLEI